MIHIKEQLLHQINQIPKRYKYLIGITIGLVSTYIMYLLILAPYLNNYIAIKNELNAHQNLLTNKTLRTQAIRKLTDAQREYETLLNKASESFFTENEADLFIKTLPQIIRGFNNQIISLKPIRMDPNTIRHRLLLTWIQTLPKHEQASAIDYIKANQEAIDAGDQKNYHIQEISKRIRSKSYESVRRVWMQGTDNEFALHRMEKIELHVKIRGSYPGFLSALQWLNEQGKLLNINRIHNHADATSSAIIHTDIELSFYVIKALTL